LRPSGMSALGRLSGTKRTFGRVVTVEGMAPLRAKVLWAKTEGAGTAQRRCLKVFAIAESVVPLRRVFPCAGAGTWTRFLAMSDVSLEQTPARHGRERPTVTATQLGVHLGLTRQRIGTLADVERVIERLPDGRFDQDACRVAYLKWLRDPARRSARSEADADFQRAKTELIKIRIAEKHRTLMLASDHEAFVEELVGLFLSRLSGFAARWAVVIWPCVEQSTKPCTTCELIYPKARPSSPTNTVSRTSRHSHATERSAFREQDAQLGRRQLVGAGDSLRRRGNVQCRLVHEQGGGGRSRNAGAAPRTRRERQHLERRTTPDPRRHRSIGSVPYRQPAELG
jgi:hypothetical protein